MTLTDYERAKAALTQLDTLGFDVKAVWRELTAREEAHETGSPSEFDLRYILPEAAPTIASHLDGGRPQVLAPHVMWMGFHYSLTPGQRRWFREFTGMTPSATVTVSWVESWKGTRHPRSFKVVSDQHIDPRLRKHTIVEMVIRDAGAFFAKAQEFDSEEVTAKVLSLHVGKVNVWSSRHKWAVKDLCGVELKGDEVEIVQVDSAWITFSDVGSRRARVDRDEFLSAVADYERLYDKKVRKERVPKSTASSMEELMAELEKGVEV